MNKSNSYINIRVTAQAISFRQRQKKGTEQSKTNNRTDENDALIQNSSGQISLATAASYVYARAANKVSLS